MRQNEAKTLTAKLLAAFPGRDVAVGTAALYVEYLERYPVEVGQNAVKRLIEGERYVPALAELREELAEENQAYEGMRRPALRAGERPPPMTDEEIREAMAPVREYLDRIGRVPREVTDEAQEEEIAEKRERARSLSEDSA